MTRIVSYNILMGAAKRVDPLTQILSDAHPDIVGLVEATRPDVVAELGRRLGMQSIMSGCAPHSGKWQVALLSRLPVLYTKTHIRPGVLLKPLLEVGLQEAGGRQITVFVIHLSAAFSQGWAGDGIRRRETMELLRIMAEKAGTPHLVMGDFNTLAPGDAFRASELLRYLLQVDERYGKNPVSHQGHPYLNFVVPRPLRIFNPLLRLVPRKAWLRAPFDRAAALYAPRSSIRILLQAGYIDCFRRLNPADPGFSCPAAAPAGRIDYIFASPALATSLTACSIPPGAAGVSGEQASDHLPVVADFVSSVPEDDRPATTDAQGRGEEESMRAQA
jgi:endonuclease/exonuclease/phosphatase family metal-dependent hydrolase